MNKNKELQTPKTYTSNVSKEKMLLDIIKQDEGFKKAIDNFDNLQEIHILYKSKPIEKKENIIYLPVVGRSGGGGWMRDFESNPIPGEPRQPTISASELLRHQVEKRLRGKTLVRDRIDNSYTWEE